MATEFKLDTNYSWNADDKFTVTGKEVEILNLLIKVYKGDPEYRKYQLINAADEFLTEIFKRNINILEEMAPIEATPSEKI